MTHRSFRFLRVALILALAVILLPRAARAQTPDTIYINGNIYTCDPENPRAQAIAFGALRSGEEQAFPGHMTIRRHNRNQPDIRIFAVGSNDDILARATAQTKIHDLEGRTVLPGLIDAHGHIAGLGSFALGRLELSQARTFEDVITSVTAAARNTPKDQWILGGRWDHESWASKELPVHEDLSRMTPDHPVWLSRVDGHAGIANQRAMEIAGITRETPDPPGGEIVRDAKGNPTGVFVDTAESLITRHITGADASAEQLILAAQELCLSAGLTGVHDAGISPAEAQVYEELATQGALKLRVYAMISAPHAIKFFGNGGKSIGDRFTVRAVKLYMDGAMGSRGAWLLEPYADRPTNEAGQPWTGLSVMSEQDVRELCDFALGHGVQVCTHAIGDRANRTVLDIYESAHRAHVLNSRNPLELAFHRFRIEHAQLLSPQDIPRFAKLGVIPSMQPTHCTSDMRWVDARVGPDRGRGAYAWASLLRSGSSIAAGSDFPVESHNPFLGFYAAVTRADLEGNWPGKESGATRHPESADQGRGETASGGSGGWHPDEKMTREEALRSMTIDAAYASFEEQIKGSLEPGKFADFIVLDRDVMTCDENEIPKTKVLMTVVGGEVVFERH